VINEYKWRKIRQMLTEIEKEIDKASAENDFDRVIDEQSKYMNLKRVEKELAEKLGNRTIV
jgi:DNA primase